jgi:exonuclease III
VTSEFGIKIASYNILSHRSTEEKGSCFYGVRPNLRTQFIAQRIGNMNPDIVCFQEVDQFSLLEKKMKKAGYSGIYAERNNVDEDKEGCAIFYKNSTILVINSSGKADYHQQIIDYYDDGTGRFVQQAKFMVLSLPGDLPITVLNTQLVNNEPADPKFSGLSRQSYEMKMLVQIATNIANRQIPVIICGDFNIPEDEEESFLHGLKHNGFVDATPPLYLMRTPNLPGFYWTKPTFKNMKNNKYAKVDYIFSNNVCRLRSFVMGNHEDLGTHREYSTHLPLMATYLLPVVKRARQTQDYVDPIFRQLPPPLMLDQAEQINRENDLADQILQQFLPSPPLNQGDEYQD